VAKPAEPAVMSSGVALAPASNTSFSTSLGSLFDDMSFQKLQSRDVIVPKASGDESRQTNDSGNARQLSRASPRRP